jgi:hypothetical protein
MFTHVNCYVWILGLLQYQISVAHDTISGSTQGQIRVCEPPDQVPATRRSRWSHTAADMDPLESRNPIKKMESENVNSIS